MSELTVESSQYTHIYRHTHSHIHTPTHTEVFIHNLHLSLSHLGIHHTHTLSLSLCRWCAILTSRPHGTHCESASHASAEHNMHVPLSRISWWPDLVIVHQLQSADTAAGDTWQQYAGTGEWNRLRLHSVGGRKVQKEWEWRLEPVNSLHKCIKYSLPMVEWVGGGENFEVSELFALYVFKRIARCTGGGFTWLLSWFLYLSRMCYKY